MTCWVCRRFASFWNWTCVRFLSFVATVSGPTRGCGDHGRTLGGRGPRRQTERAMPGLLAGYRRGTRPQRPRGEDPSSTRSGDSPGVPVAGPGYSWAGERLRGHNLCRTEANPATGSQADASRSCGFRAEGFARKHGSCAIQEAVQKPVRRHRGNCCHFSRNSGRTALAPRTCMSRISQECRLNASVFRAGSLGLGHENIVSLGELLLTPDRRFGPGQRAELWRRRSTWLVKSQVLVNVCALRRN